MSRGPWKHKRKQKAARQVVDADPVLSLSDIDPVIMEGHDGGSKPIGRLKSYDGKTGNAIIVITDADIELLPASIRYQIEAVSRARKALRMPDNLRERQAAAVRAFKGDRPR